MTWSTRPSLPAGHIVTADEFDAILDQIDTLTAPGWTSYTLAWTSSGTAPALGNAVVVSEYRQAAGSDMADVEVSITFGTTSTYGTGVWFFSVPFTMHANQVGRPAGTAWALDSGVKEGGGVCNAVTTTTFRVAAAPSTGGAFSNWGPADPFASWGTGDIFRATLRVRLA